MSYLNFEDVFLKNITHKELLEVFSIFKENIDSMPNLLLLDEIQEVKEWGKILSSLLDMGYDIVVTDSSSKLLSKEVATQLSGRTLSYISLPFSFKEFVSYKDKKILKHFPLVSISEKVRFISLLEETCAMGGI